MRLSTLHGAIHRALLAGLLAMAAPAVAQSLDDATRITLEEAVERTLQHNPQRAQAAGSVRTAQASERAAFGQWLPTFGVSAGTTVASTERFDEYTSRQVQGSAGSFNAGLSASWSLYTGGRRGAAIRQTEALSSVAGSQLISAEAEVAYLAQSTFFAELGAQQLLEVARARVSRAEQLLDAARRRQQVGSATRSDVLRAELELNTARQALLEAETNRRSTAFSLGRLVGLDGPAVAQAPSASELAPVPSEEVVAAIVESAPTVLSAQAQLEASGAGVDVARSSYLPSANVTAGYDVYNPGYLDFAPNQGWSVRLGISWQIFDAWQRDETVERARVQQTVASSQLADARRQVRAEAERALGQVRLAHERILLAEQSVTVSADDLDVQQQRYELGTTTILDLLTSQTALVEAQTNLVTARFEYVVARAELEALAGRKL